MPLPIAFLPSGQEWIWILIIVLLFFGGAKIPSLMRGLGRGVGELKTGLDEGKRAFQSSSNPTNDTDETAANNATKP